MNLAKHRNLIKPNKEIALDFAGKKDRTKNPHLINIQEESQIRQNHAQWKNVF